ncbi:MAG: DUF4032 domain-containing protein [Bacteroidota bacterium]
MTRKDAIPAFSLQADNVRFFLDLKDRSHLIDLPWQYPLESWHEHKVKHVNVKSGLSRHIVRFVEIDHRRYAIKETTREAAQREFRNYIRLMKMDVPTLIPVGIVTRDEGYAAVETAIGPQMEPRETGYLVTELMEKVIPDSFLFKRAFSKENRNRIWDTVIRLFISMHSQGVYWGDASLANMLIHFSTEVVPELGRRTKLQAVLADAETVEIHPGISDKLRLADVEFFLESMLWTEADLTASGIVRDPLITQKDQNYVLQSYTEQYAVELEMQSFELVTHIDADKLLGNFDEKGYGKLLLQHIHEHKWYISENRKAEVPLVESAEDWYKEVFKPVCKIFHDYGLLKFFPDKTASSLYVEVMEHKYFMSQQEKKDVGLETALEDYCKRFAKQEPFRVTVDNIVDALTSLFKRHAPIGTNLHLATL